ncbi:Lrp/AsnC family transcriptional regulator [Streptomyces sp. NPDC046909]|uniref:Lrp/AsnC family transcriptional regulator n=1 Tax=Streptomyces sp. NPDC046909 TaxID=3155617 RepID=UPI0033C73582
MHDEGILPDWDDLDRLLLRELEHDGRASFARLGTVLGVSDQTAARRYRRLAEFGGLRIAAERGLQYPGQETWLLRLQCTLGQTQAVATALAQRPDTAWVALVSGGTELNCAVRFRNRDDQEDLLLNKLPRTPGVASVRALQILGMFFGGPTVWLDKRLGQDRAPVYERSPREEHRGKAAGPEDEVLIAALEQDARIPLAELAKATGRSENAVRRRLDQLLARGDLYFNIQYDSRVLGDSLHALLWINAAPQKLEQTGRWLAQQPRVSFVTVTTGATNLTAMVTCTDAAGLRNYLGEDLAGAEGLHHVEVTPVLRHVKQVLPLTHKV